MKRSLRAVLLCLLLALSAGLAYAEDLTPPPWQRYQPGTTFARWEFSMPDPQPVPDQFYNPYGLLNTLVQPGLLQSWQPVWGGRQGVWPLSGTIQVTIPNSPVANPYKDIFVQLTWAQQAPNVFPIIRDVSSNTFASLVHQIALGPTGESFGDGMWYYGLYQMRLYPNPSSETLIIDGAVMVDELVIDTRCVPEPSSILALGIGTIGMLGLIRRKRS